jgi:tRNA(adenine34) deaminase
MRIAIDQESYLRHEAWMDLALRLAERAGKQGEIPVAALVVDREGKLLAATTNRKEREQDGTAHAEVLALSLASRTRKTWHLEDCTLYVTLEPCPMCAGAIIQARLGLLVYGADDPKTGCIRTVANFPDSFFSNHRLAVIAGVREKACRQQLQTWFQARRG